MKRQTTLYFNETDMSRLAELKEVYDQDNTSALISMLIQKEISRVRHYREIIIKDN